MISMYYMTIFSQSKKKEKRVVSLETSHAQMELSAEHSLAPES